MRARLLAPVLLAALLGACPGRVPTDQTPEGAVQLLLDAMRLRDAERAHDLLAAPTRTELARRARQASAEAGRTLAPAEMLAVERFVLRWELGRMRSSIEGDRATVTVAGAESSERAELSCLRENGRWRVVLPL